MPRQLGLIAAAASLVLLTACGGGKGGSSVNVRWEAQQGGAVLVDVNDASASSTLHQTYVYIRAGDSTLHKASLRLRGDYPLGINVAGTVANMPTQIDGHDQVWDIGDIEPGQGVRFPLGVWFDVNPGLDKATGLSIRLELSSPDLPRPIASSELQVAVTHGS